MNHTDTAKNTRAMTKSTLILTAISAVGLVLSFAKEAVIAFFFGTSAVVDAYVVAIDLPVMFFATASMALAAVVIPNYTQLRVNEGEESAKQFFNKFTTLLMVAGAAFLLLLELLADPIVFIGAPGLSAEMHDYAVTMFRVALPASLVLLFVKTNTGVLNSHKSFALPSLGNLVLSVVFIVFVALLAGHFGIYAAVWATLLGAMVELLYSVAIRRRYVRYHPDAGFKDERVKRSLRMALPVAIGISIEELNRIIDKAIASSLEEGSISALHYASKISSGISNLLISSISVVFYPEYAQKASEGDDKGLAETYGVSINLYLLIIVPLIAGGFFLREEIVSLVYGRGAFDATSLAMTAPLFVGYLACLLFTSVRQSCTNFFNAYGETKIPAINTVIGVLLNVALNFLLSHFWGALGLVIATLISSAVTAVLLMIAVRRRNTHVRYGKNLLLFAKTAVAAVLMLAALVGVRVLFSLAFGEVLALWQSLLYLVVAVALGAIVYAIGLYVLRVREIKMVVGLLKRKK